jgi:hypothetical protein
MARIEPELIATSAERGIVLHAFARTPTSSTDARAILASLAQHHADAIAALTSLVSPITAGQMMLDVVQQQHRTMYDATVDIPEEEEEEEEDGAQESHLAACLHTRVAQFVREEDAQRDNQDYLPFADWTHSPEVAAVQATILADESFTCVKALAMMRQAHTRVSVSPTGTSSDSTRTCG